MGLRVKIRIESLFVVLCNSLALFPGSMCHNTYVSSIRQSSAWIRFFSRARKVAGTVAGNLDFKSIP